MLEQHLLIIILGEPHHITFYLSCKSKMHAKYEIKLGVSVSIKRGYSDNQNLSRVI